MPDKSDRLFTYVAARAPAKLPSPGIAYVTHLNSMTAGGQSVQPIYAWCRIIYCMPLWYMVQGI